jgi:hypothetical protein
LSKGLIAPAVGALAIALIAAGCGGGGETATASITKAQFIRRADAICDKADHYFQTLYEKYLGDTEDIRAKQRLIDRRTQITDRVFAPAVERELGEIRALGAPGGDEAQIKAILAAREEGLEKVEEHPLEVANTEDEFLKSYKLATEYGLKVCGR